MKFWQGKSGKLRAILCGGVLLAAVLVTQIGLYSQNTLLRNGHWLGHKLMLGMGLTGGYEFVLARSSLAGNHLDLGSWYGYQEAILKDSVKPRELRFTFQIPRDSYLDINAGVGASEFSGLRLSRLRAFPSMVFVSDTEGKFLSTTPLVLPEIGDGWHSAILTFAAAGASVSIDGGPAVQTAWRAPEGHVSFRAGRQGAKIDDIEITSMDGNIFRDSFSNTEGIWRVFTLHFIFLGLLFLAFPWRIFFRHSSSNKIIKFKILVIYQLCVCLALLYAFDFCYWSKLPFHGKMRFLSTGKDIKELYAEDLRFSFFEAWAQVMGIGQDVAAKLHDEPYPEQIFNGPIYCGPNEDTCRAYGPGQWPESFIPTEGCAHILYLGSSQTVGVGADSLDQTFVARLHKQVRSARAPGCVESLNISVSSGTVKIVEKNFRDKFLGFKPSLVVVNFSTNDAVDSFEADLDSLLELGRHLKIPMLLVAEPNSTEAAGTVTPLYEKHKIVESLAERYRVPYLPLHEYLAQPSVLGSGFLWWDFVHLTSYGHKLAAEWLAPRVLRALPAQLK